MLIVLAVELQKVFILNNYYIHTSLYNTNQTLNSVYKKYIFLLNKAVFSVNFKVFDWYYKIMCVYKLFKGKRLLKPKCQWLIFTILVIYYYILNANRKVHCFSKPRKSIILLSVCPTLSANQGRYIRKI